MGESRRRQAWALELQTTGVYSLGQRKANMSTGAAVCWNLAGSGCAVAPQLSVGIQSVSDAYFGLSIWIPRVRCNPSRRQPRELYKGTTAEHDGTDLATGSDITYRAKELPTSF